LVHELHGSDGNRFLQRSIWENIGVLGSWLNIQLIYILISLRIGVLLNSNPAGSLSLSGRLKFLLRDASIYGGAAAISKAFMLITFPLLARHFTVEEYGLLDYFLVLAGLLAALFIFGQDSAVARFFYEYEDADIRQQLISQSLVFQLSGLTLLLPLLWVGAEWLTRIMIAAPDGVLFFKIMLLQLPSLLLINFSQNLLKWTFARTCFLTLSIGFTVIQSGLLMVAVLVLDVGIAGVLMISLVTSTLFGGLGLFFVRKWLVRPRNFSRLREMLPFAIPYGVICVVGALLPTLERTLTDRLLGAESLGLYAVGTKIAMLIGLLGSAFQIAWGPFSLSLYKQSDAGSTYNWVLKIFVLAMCIAVLMLTLLAYPLISFLATERFLGAVVVVFPLAMGTAIQATSWITEIGISISKRSHLSLYAYAVAIMVTLAGILMLTPIFGLFGIGLGVLLGHIVKAVVASYLAQQAYPLPWQYFPVLLLMTLTMVSGLTFIWVSKLLGVLAGNLLLVGAMLLVVGVSWLMLFSQTERIRVKALLQRFCTSI
jgi:O-antigen/teichoic acid export membrane protein